ncbi:MAG: hypothetical protein U0790_25095 [Isosphaeraceae bacterium]
MAKQSGSGTREPIAAGNIGVVVGVYDLGTQEGKFGPKHQVLLQFELSRA